MLDALSNDLLGDLVEGDAARLAVRQLQKLLQMPGNGLPFPVRVRGEIDGAGAFGVLFELLDQLCLVPHRNILGLKALFYINAHLAFGKVPQMPHGSRDLIAAAQVFFDGFGLGGRFHDHKIFRFCHVRSSLFGDIQLIEIARIALDVILDGQNGQMAQHARRGKPCAQDDIVHMGPCGIDGRDDGQLILRQVGELISQVNIALGFWLVNAFFFLGRFRNGLGRWFCSGKGSRIVSRVTKLSGKEDLKILQHIPAAGGKVCPLLQHGKSPCAVFRVHIAGNGEDFLPLLQRLLGKEPGAAVLRRLHHHEGHRDPRCDAVSFPEKLALGMAAWRIFA